ncbi:hypothetical protein JNB_13328 [Janibacter sp. HTCC2649]|uniref:hypothetical protein n=1 Tax=Janibacter sp. HTCC2649 TaxID=313589 RepID=UPI00006718F9|nr:hypothetical protein [Janibacter sp. HTCC2649]EAP97948.1 hypothetical protein JNB_13328 [Janibacter sp. HTCC2649]
MSKRALTAVLALSFALAGCGSAGDKSTAKPVASTPAAASTGTSSSSTPNTATTPELPKGYTWQTIEDASLKFAVPEAWSAINPKKLIAEGDTSVFDDMAKKMGITSDQMMQAVGNADLMLLAPPKDGYAANVSGLIVPLEGLPTEAQLKGQLGAMSETDVVVTPGTSAAGPMIAADYVLKVGAASVQGRTQFFQGEDGVLNLAISTLDTKTTAAVSEAIRSTIHKV